jgi:hypothetical protein
MCLGVVTKWTRKWTIFPAFSAATCNLMPGKGLLRTALRQAADGYKDGIG